MQINEAEALRSLEPFVQKTAKRYFRGDAVEDGAQIGRIAALQAIRSWRPEACKLSTHAMRNIWWDIHSFAMKERRVASVVLLDEPERTWRDQTGINPETAVAVLEIFNALPPDEQEAVEKLVKGSASNNPSNAQRSAAERARAFVEGESTKKEAPQRAVSKLTPHLGDIERRLLAGEPMVSIAKTYGVCYQAIQKVRNDLGLKANGTASRSDKAA